MTPTTDWNPILRAEFGKPYWAELLDFVAAERTAHTVFPPHDEVFAAIHLTPHADVKVLILGQDPYHGPGQAHGLCFSVGTGVRVPPSLVNIYKEMETDLGLPIPSNGNLERWARQGVLLLNTSLTVRSGEAASHQGKPFFVVNLLGQGDVKAVLFWMEFEEIKTLNVAGPRESKVPGIKQMAMAFVKDLVVAVREREKG